MRRIVESAHHAASLLRKLGLRRFSIVLVYWTLRRYRHLFGPNFDRFCGRISRDKIAQNPVLIYQMSKVGSTSLLYSLQFAYLKIGLSNVPLHHLHTLTQLDLHEQLAKQYFGAAEQRLVRDYKKIWKDFEARPEEHWTAISMVRDPVARQISDYFHHIGRHLPDCRRRWNEGSLTVDDVLQNFLTVPDHTREWFDSEIRSVLGIDVFSSPFPHEAGYSLYSRPPKMTLMVMRLEDMDRVAGRAIEQLLGIKRFKLYSFNLGSEGDYRDIYNQFKTKPLPAWYIEKAYSSKLACHFYNDTERDQFAKKWTKAGTRVR